jgi:hypothetical protein
LILTNPKQSPQFHENDRLQTKTIPQFYDKNLGVVSKIVILDGTTGHKKTMTSNKVIKGFLSEIKEVKFIPDENQEDRKGYKYSITLFREDKSIFQFRSEEVNGHYYHTEPDINPIVDRFYINL